MTQESDGVPDQAADAAPRPLVKVVGPCKSGKSTLVDGLRVRGYWARACAQEHSDMPTMWERIVPADVLVYLDASLETIQARSGRSDWTAARLERQRQRLSHAREHCDFYVSTDGLDPAAVLADVTRFLDSLVGKGSDQDS